ncbi:MAG: hypothetical protein L0Y56_19155, partial [Nitrospira sp.]|nr:hypothetical protein [Nitrospira sp.]
GRVVSLYVPGLGTQRKRFVSKEELVDYFQRRVFDPGIWNSRVLTVYGDGEFHHFTYALTRLALNRHRPGHWTYFHFDNHRDDWGNRGRDGYKEELDCASFVDQISHDYNATPFMVGPDVYAKKDAAGYLIRGRRIPIYSNFFTKELQRSRQWANNVALQGLQTGVELPASADLRSTPTETYLSFDLDLLARSEIVTNFDQNDGATLQRLCQILDKIRPFKRVFSADILGFPDTCHHPLSALTILILARKVMGLGTDRLLSYHGHLKQKQAGLVTAGVVELTEKDRVSPLSEGELLEVVHG